MDAIIGLGLVAVLSLAVVGVVSKQNAASQQLAETRAALQLAEQVLSDLQVGREPAEIGDAKWEIRPLETVEAPPEMNWVSVEVTHHGKTVELYGTIPSSVDPSGATRGGS